MDLHFRNVHIFSISDASERKKEGELVLSTQECQSNLNNDICFIFTVEYSKLTVLSLILSFWRCCDVSLNDYIDTYRSPFHLRCDKCAVLIRCTRISWKRSIKVRFIVAVHMSNRRRYNHFISPSVVISVFIFAVFAWLPGFVPAHAKKP